jgi:hypothetical protein
MNRLEWESTTTPERTGGGRRPAAPAAAPDVPNRLLDPRIRASQMAAVRASLARSLQAGIGNRAVGAMLLRDPAAAAPPPPVVVAHMTGKEIDDALSASPYFAKLVEARFKDGTKADGHVHVESEVVFEEAYTKMAMTCRNPATGANFTEAEARDRAKNVAAFQDEGEIHVNETAGDAGTVVHESMHLFSHDFLKKTGTNANEGAAEYFAKKLCAELGVARGVHYADQLARVEKLAALAGDDVLAAAYFQDKLAELEAAVDAKKAPGTFAQWVTAMRAGKYAEADALLS